MMISQQFDHHSYNFYWITSKDTSLTYSLSNVSCISSTDIKIHLDNYFQNSNQVLSKGSDHHLCLLCIQCFEVSDLYFLYFN